MISRERRHLERIVTTSRKQAVDFSVLLLLICMAVFSLFSGVWINASLMGSLALIEFFIVRSENATITRLIDEAEELYTKSRNNT